MRPSASPLLRERKNTDPPTHPAKEKKFTRHMQAVGTIFPARVRRRIRFPSVVHLGFVKGHRAQNYRESLKEDAGTELWKAWVVHLPGAKQSRMMVKSEGEPGSS